MTNAQICTNLSTADCRSSSHWLSGVAGPLHVFSHRRDPMGSVFANRRCGRQRSVVGVAWRFGRLVTTFGYSLVLKRKLLIDVVTLAALYTIRVVAGSVAVRVTMSEWLLTFCIFIFLSLALIKRYSELAIRFDSGFPDPTNRNYKKDDLPIVSSLAAAVWLLCRRHIRAVFVQR